MTFHLTLLDLAGMVALLLWGVRMVQTGIQRGFEVAMRQLSDDAIMLTGAEMQLGRGDSLADTARLRSRYVDTIMLRTDAPEMLHAMAEYATIPVINGLT